MNAEVHVESIEKKETRNGNTRWVVRDGDGREYTTFRPRIGEEAERFEGRRARIEYHEEQRGGFQNVYLDGIAPAAETAQEGRDSDPDEVAWNTAVEAAPWLLGTSEPDKALEPDELFDKLEPFKQRVSEDIRGDSDADGE